MPMMKTMQLVVQNLSLNISLPYLQNFVRNQQLLSISLVLFILQLNHSFNVHSFSMTYLSMSVDWLFNGISKQLEHIIQYFLFVKPMHSIIPLIWSVVPIFTVKQIILNLKNFFHN